MLKDGLAFGGEMQEMVLADKFLNTCMMSRINTRNKPMAIDTLTVLTTISLT